MMMLSHPISMAMTADVALSDGTNVMKRFLVQNTRITDLNMFLDMVGISNYDYQRLFLYLCYCQPLSLQN